MGQNDIREPTTGRVRKRNSRDRSADGLLSTSQCRRRTCRSSRREKWSDTRMSGDEFAASHVIRNKSK